jgi:AAA family ATP:ADP antiporter
LFLYSLSSTFVYFEQANIIDAALSDRAARAALFARIDAWVNGLTLVTQLLWTGRIIKRLGVALVLAMLPLVSAIGFVVLAGAPILPVLVVFQIVRRATNYALVKPARETLFTVVSRDARYKAKNFIDTFVYRGGDALGAWGFSLLQRLGLGLSQLALAAVPLALVWAVVGFFLGRRQRRAAAGESTTSAEPPVPSV